MIVDWTRESKQSPRRFLATLFTIVLTGILAFTLYVHRILFTPMLSFIGLGLIAFFIIIGLKQSGQVRKLEEKPEA